MANQSQPEIRIVIFDLGGVLVELGGVDDFGELIGVDHSDEIWRRWLTCPWVRRYERGQCSREDFAAGMVAEHEIDLAPEEFLIKFGDWPKGLFPGAEDLVQGLAEHVTIACLSNTNEMHWNEQRGADILHQLFERRFLSHELGLIKPDREIFDHVVATFDCQPNEILFLDDNLLNVQGAQEVGLDAHVTVGVEQTRSVLKMRGVWR